MELTVKLEDVMEAIELHTMESNYFYYKKDGNVYYISDEELRAAEDDYDLEDFPEWQHDSIKRAEDIISTMDYIRLPDRHDINDYDIMEAFCLSIEDDELSEIMYDSIKGSGAFRRFKENIHKYGIADDWYDYQEYIYIEIAKDWCKEHGIKYIEGDRNNG